MIRPIAVLTVVAAFCLPTLVSLASAETIIEARQRLMVSMVRATKIPRAMVQGEADFDAEAVKEAVKQVLEASSVMPKLFPDGSVDPSSTALPTIFENRVDFEARIIELEKSAVALAFAAQSGPDELAFAFGEYEATCDSCHQKYRKPE